MILRHKLETIDLKLDENGWASVRELFEKSAKSGNVFTRAEFETIVETNDKKRFIFDAGGEKLRANQGRSIKVEIGFEEKIPPETLYHGTAEKNVKAILQNGLQKMRRHHVHLSADTETAQTVGKRYGKPVIFKVDTSKMLKANFAFFVSANGVWLVDSVPPEFLEIL